MATRSSRAWRISIASCAIRSAICWARWRGFQKAERVEVAAMPELERYVLALLAKLDGELRQAVADFDFNTYVRALTDFCNEDLSRLLLRYPQGFALLRRGGRCQADGLPHGAGYAVPCAGALCRAGAGVHGGGDLGDAVSGCGSVHLLEWPDVDPGCPDEDLIDRWKAVRPEQPVFRLLDGMRSRNEQSSRRCEASASSLEASLAFVRDADFADFRRSI